MSERDRSKDKNGGKKKSGRGWALRVFVLAVVLSKTALGSAGIWCAWPVGWTVATFLSVLFYKQGYWNRMQETV